MNTFLALSTILLWLLVLLLGFLLLGALRALSLLNWRFDQMEALTPRRLDREGLKVGAKAPDFTLTSADGTDVALRDFAGRQVLLVFTQAGCGPCHEIAPELNRVQLKGQQQVLVVNNGEATVTRDWAKEIAAQFPVLAQEKYSLSRRFQVYATPFAFLIDEAGTIVSKGIVGTRQYLGYVLSKVRAEAKDDHSPVDPSVKGSVESEALNSNPSKEVAHV